MKKTKAAAVDYRKLSRTLTVVENGLNGANDILLSLQPKAVPIIGITGPPGAGKSTLLSELIELLTARDLNVAVVSVDPTSPFTFGALLGDRIRMQKHSTSANVFIRSLASRGHLGGLSSKIIEITDVIRSENFDYIFVETVGVGQSEVEVAGLADITVLVLVPESGDEVQSIKSGIMEVADIFVVNKADRDGADEFAGTLRKLNNSDVPVLQTVASDGKGVKELLSFIEHRAMTNKSKIPLLASKAWQLIQTRRMADIQVNQLQAEIAEASLDQNFNLYKFVESKIRSS
jgi:LAO/AO transport system kinase